VRAVLATLLAVTVTAGLAGCGEKREHTGPVRPEPFTVLLDYFPNADHAPIYAALENGRFRALGLDVRVRAPSDPSAPIAQAAAGRADVAISYEPQVFRARDGGTRVVSVGALVQRPLTSIVSLPQARIRGPGDLRGKRVGTAGIDYQAAFLRTILTRAGVDPATVPVQDVGFNLVPALLTRRVDAVLGAFFNYEGVQLKLERRNPQIIPVDRAGVPTYDELVFVAAPGRLADPAGRGRLRRFLEGVERGRQDLERNPNAGLRELLRANPDLDPRLQRASLAVTMPLYAPPRGKPFGWQEPREWKAFAAWMRANRLLRSPAAERGAFTNELLPGRGL
jgi:putative hydroxymethylpyrimidine transport system substrate-binding protein